MARRSVSRAANTSLPFEVREWLEGELRRRGIKDYGKLTAQLARKLVEAAGAATGPGGHDPACSFCGRSRPNSSQKSLTSAGRQPEVSAASPLPSVGAGKARLSCCLGRLERDMATPGPRQRAALFWMAARPSLKPVPTRLGAAHP